MQHLYHVFGFRDYRRIWQRGLRFRMDPQDRRCPKWFHLGGISLVAGAIPVAGLRHLHIYSERLAWQFGLLKRSLVRLVTHANESLGFRELTVFRKYSVHDKFETRMGLGLRKTVLPGAGSLRALNPECQDN